MSKFPVKWYHSFMNGSPQVSSNAGTLVSFLDACLIDGFGGVDINSCVISNNQLRFEHGENNKFEKNTVVEITGLDLLNGEYRVKAVGNTYTILETDKEDQEINQPFNVRIPSLGWRKVTSNGDVIYIPKSSKENIGLKIKDPKANYVNVDIVKINEANDVEVLNPDKKNIRGFTFSNSNINVYIAWKKSKDNQTKTTPVMLVGDGSFFYINFGRQEYQKDKREDLFFGDLVFFGLLDIEGMTDEEKKVILSGYYFNNEVNPSSNSAKYFNSPFFSNWDRVRSDYPIIKAKPVNSDNRAISAVEVIPMASTDTLTRFSQSSEYILASGHKDTFCTPSFPTNIGFGISRVKVIENKLVVAKLPGVYWITNAYEQLLDFMFYKKDNKLLMVRPYNFETTSYYSYNDRVTYGAIDIQGPW